MANISANDLKVKGIASIEASLANASEAIISVRGKDRFVVMDVAHYQYLRECELDAALAQSRADIAMELGDPGGAAATLKTLLKVMPEKMHIIYVRVMLIEMEIVVI